MTKLILSVFGFLVINLTFGQTNSLRIIVKDKGSKESLIGVTVYSKLLEKGAVSDIDGQLIINDIPNGKHQFVISYIGYESIDTTFVFPLQTNNLLCLSACFPKVIPFI